MIRIVYVDSDKKTFSISEPLYDDSVATEGTAIYQQSGRNVNIFSISAEIRLEDIKTEYQLLGYKYDEYARW